MSHLKCPGQDSRFLKAQDVAEARCPECGRLLEFWPDELMRKCPGCGRRLANPQNSMKCLSWCRHAAQCLAAIRGGVPDTPVPHTAQAVKEAQWPSEKSSR